jgi:hypothetical protein
MGLRSPPIGTANGRTSNSCNNKLPGMRKRPRSGSPSMLLLPSNFPNSRRLSQSTLQKIFIGMMGTAFSLYVVLTAYLIRHHHTIDHQGNSGISWGPGIQDNDSILRAHILRLRELQPQQLLIQRTNATKQMLTDSLRNTTEKIVTDGAFHAVSSDRGSQPKQRHHPKIASLTLEEVDIHDMKHPNELHNKEPINATLKATTEQTSSGFRILKAYLEPINLEDWDVKPLPVRNITAKQLQVIEYTRVNSCQRLPELWPIDDFPDADPFLP